MTRMDCMLQMNCMLQITIRSQEFTTRKLFTDNLEVRWAEGRRDETEEHRTFGLTLPLLSNSSKKSQWLLLL